MKITGMLLAGSLIARLMMAQQYTEEPGPKSFSFGGFAWDPTTMCKSGQECIPFVYQFSILDKYCLTATNWRVELKDGMVVKISVSEDREDSFRHRWTVKVLDDRIANGGVIRFDEIKVSGCT